MIELLEKNARNNLKWAEEILPKESDFGVKKIEDIFDDIVSTEACLANFNTFMEIIFELNKTIYDELSKESENVFEHKYTIVRKFREILASCDADDAADTAEPSSTIEPTIVNDPVSTLDMYNKHINTDGVQLKSATAKVNDGYIDICDGDTVYVEEISDTEIRLYPKRNILNAVFRDALALYFKYDVRGNDNSVKVERPCILHKTSYGYMIDKQGLVIIH